MNSGVKKALGIIVTAGAYAFVDRYVRIGTGVYYINLTFGHSFIYFTSATFGMLVGTLSGMLGEAIYQFMKHSFDLPEIIAIGVAAAIIAFYMRKVKIREGFFSQSDAAHLNLVLFAANIIGYSIVYPILTCLLAQKLNSAPFVVGFQMALSYFASSIIPTTLTLSIFARSRFSEANFIRD